MNTYSMSIFPNRVYDMSATGQYDHDVWSNVMAAIEDGFLVADIKGIFLDGQQPVALTPDLIGTIGAIMPTVSEYGFDLIVVLIKNEQSETIAKVVFDVAAEQFFLAAQKPVIFQLEEK